MWRWEGTWGYIRKLLGKKDTPERTAMGKLIDNETAFMLKLGQPEAFVLPGPATDASAAADERHCHAVGFDDRVNEWAHVARGGAEPTVDVTPYNAARSGRILCRLSNDPAVEREVLYLYIRESAEFCSLWGVFMHWLWAQWFNVGSGRARDMPTALARLDLTDSSRRVAWDKVFDLKAPKNKVRLPKFILEVEDDMRHGKFPSIKPVSICPSGGGLLASNACKQCNCMRAHAG